MAQVSRMFRRWRSDDGAQLIEYALVLPLLLLVVLGIAEFGFVFQRYEVVTNAAREGARMAVLPGYGTVQGQAAVVARVNAYVTAGRVPVTSSPVNPTVTIVNDTVPVPGFAPVNIRRVTVTYTHQILFLKAIDDFFGVTYSTVPMTAVSEMRLESGS